MIGSLSIWSCHRRGASMAESRHKALARAGLRDRHLTALRALVAASVPVSHEGPFIRLPGCPHPFREIIFETLQKRGFFVRTLRGFVPTLPGRAFVEGIRLASELTSVRESIAELWDEDST